ncbi:hypothetical protein H310_06098 [Aphanomyces invadans]|uniref:Uncharacterized protein n=1 Tax=Aphanomyces invadans TaxID=157072 RepID=A0A024U8U0_9STRA|nr:hypothetical protein H310_06098 [Aphanomyces invadans]ETW02635.1 hypothetical protein H310_06098 [Aphanomyces invadans]|eukprot:XP_008869240.1 hypothetical protein H310_06098 [Aphanomyces invadans]
MNGVDVKIARLVGRERGLSVVGATVVLVKVVLAARDVVLVGVQAVHEGFVVVGAGVLGRSSSSCRGNRRCFLARFVTATAERVGNGTDRTVGNRATGTKGHTGGNSAQQAGHHAAALLLHGSRSRGRLHGCRSRRGFRSGLSSWGRRRAARRRRRTGAGHCRVRGSC